VISEAGGGTICSNGEGAEALPKSDPSVPSCGSTSSGPRPCRLALHESIQIARAGVTIAAPLSTKPRRTSVLPTQARALFQSIGGLGGHHAAPSTTHGAPSCARQVVDPLQTRRGTRPAWPAHRLAAPRRTNRFDVYRSEACATPVVFNSYAASHAGQRGTTGEARPYCHDVELRAPQFGCGGADRAFAAAYIMQLNVYKVAFLSCRSGHRPGLDSPAAPACHASRIAAIVRRAPTRTGGPTDTPGKVSRSTGGDPPPSPGTAGSAEVGGSWIRLSANMLDASDSEGWEGQGSHGRADGEAWVAPSRGRGA